MASNRHTVIPRVLCFIFSQDAKEMVMMKASKDKDWTGRYNPPGGHIEKGESVIDAAEKEISEETGLMPESTKLKGIIHELGFFGKDVMLFITVSVAKKKSMTEHREGIPVWVKVDSLGEFNILEDIQPILDKLMKLKGDQLLIGTCEWDEKNNLSSLNLTVG